MSMIDPYHQEMLYRQQMAQYNASQRRAGYDRATGRPIAYFEDMQQIKQQGAPKESINPLLLLEDV